MSEPTANSENQRHATNLELFLDLAFVLSVAQATTFISSNLTLTGILKGVLLTWFIWWLWTAFAWTGAAVDFQSSAKHRVFILCMIPMLLIMAASVPQAFGDLSTWFALSYLVVMVWITLLQGIDAWADVDTKKAWLSYGPFALIAPFILVAGSFFEGSTQISIWCVAVVVHIASALFGARSSKNKWVIDAAQFTERHCLFMIISLGEIIVAVGLKATGIIEKQNFTFELASGVVVAGAIACIYSWTYFAYIPNVLEHALASAEEKRKGLIARDLFSFGHFPIVLSFMFFAVVAKHLLEHPFEPFANIDLVLIGVSVSLFMIAILHIQLRLSHSLSIERIALLVAAICIAFLGQFISAIFTLLLICIATGSTSTLLWFRYKKKAQLNPSEG